MTNPAACVDQQARRPARIAPVVSLPPSPSRSRFTGKERDTESGNDYFKYRYYASSTGRWLSPDPSGLAYANLADPQSLNLYSYVGNHPLTFVDLEGLCWKGFQWACDLGNDIKNAAVSVKNGFEYGQWTPNTKQAEIRSLDRQEAQDRNAEYQQETGNSRPPNSSGGGQMWWDNYLKRRPNPYVGYGTDAAGVGATLFKIPYLGPASALLNYANDPNAKSAITNGLSLLPGEGATWPTTVFVDGFDYGINHSDPGVKMTGQAEPFTDGSAPGGNYGGSTSGGGASMTQFGCQMTGDC